MPKKKLLSSLLILVVILAIAGFLSYLKKSFYLAKAAVSDNVSGYAWSENIGWISVNNTANYGVNINMQSGDLTGYAWSENIGWISFNRIDAGNPPAAPFNGGSGAIAKYDLNTKEITGWARVLASGDGWDGWIRFCDTSMANCSNKIARIDDDGNWHGWAWSDVVMGWISLNCANQVNCGVSDYKVKINLPVNGQCGPANNNTYPASYTQPPVASLCNTGSASSISGDGSQVTPWIWICNGLNGGSPSLQCSARKCVATQPVWGNCDKSCGGGSRTGTYQDENCNNRTTSQACNSQPCPPSYREVTPW